MTVSSVFSILFSDKKTLLAGLWIIWLCGILLIGISFYATQMLPMFPPSLKDSYLLGHSIVNSIDPSITIFTAPSPFTGSVGERQAFAIRSWLALSANITVVLFSQDQSVFSFAAQFDSRVFVDPDIDFTFLHTPFFHSMIARSKSSASSDVSVLVDPEIILLEDFVATLNFAHKLDQDWLLFASSQNISHLPFYLDATGKDWLTYDGRKVRRQKLQGFLAQNWKGEHCEGKMLMAWNNGELPLHSGVLPPFLYGKGVHYSWLIAEALSSDFRFVIDASCAIYSFHFSGHHQSNEFSSYSKFENRSWEYVGNSHLGSVYGSLSFREANYSNMFTLFKCSRRYLFLNTIRGIVYETRYDGLLHLREEIISGPIREKKILDCSNFIQSDGKIRDCSLKDRLSLSPLLPLPFSLQFLLSMRADHNKTIVLAVAGYNYKDMLMSWVCRLRRLLISNFLICALDDEIYDYSVVQGLPVFKDPYAPTNISFDDCHFGTKCFQRVTKVKSRVVLQILKLGYNVLLSDVDVYWFKNPLPFLISFGPSIFVAQSDEYRKTGPINLPRRLNSGFYFARSDDSTIAALVKVVKHAASSTLSEQPSFYDTLCGEGGSKRIGDDRCLDPDTNLTVYFLDRDLFPNGAYRELWEEKNVKAACVRQGCYILHNNWISGRRKKFERQVLSGLWEYDMGTRMCLQSWHNHSSSINYF